jgi:O-antigen/teichoic acid export membrane protein
MADVQPGSPPRLLHYLSRYFSTEAINSVATIAGVAVFTRLVDPAGYGEYALIVAGSGIVSAVAGEWLQASTLRLVPGPASPAREARVRTARRLATQVALAVFALTIACWLAWPNARVGRMVLLGGTYAALNLLFLTLTVLFQATLRAGSFTAFRSAFAFLRIACAVAIAMLVSRSGLALVAGFVLSLAVLIPLAFIQLRDGSSVADDAAAGATTTEFLGFGLPLVAWYAASQILNLSDRFFLEGARGTEEVGIYSVTYSLAMGVVGGILQPLLATMHPLIVHAWHEHGEAAARARLGSALRAVVLVGPLLALGLGLFGRSLLRILAPERYGTSGMLAAILGAGIVCWYSGLFLQKELELRLDSRGLVRNLWIAALVNIAANIFLIPMIGMLGAALATLGGYATYVILTIVAAGRGIPAIGIRTIAWVAAATVAAAGAAMGLERLPALQTSLLELLVAGPCVVFVYIAMLAIGGELAEFRRVLRPRAAS